MAAFALLLAAHPAAAQVRPTPPPPPPPAAPAAPPAAQDDDAAARDTVPVRAPTQVVPGQPTAPDTVPARSPDAAPADTSRQAAREAAERAAAADTIFQALRRLQGYTVMEYRGDSATFNADQRVLRLFGDSEVAREGDRLTASDTIIYREATRVVEAYGSPAISGQAERIEGNVMFYDLATRRATVRGGRTQVAEAGASWYVRGDVTAEGTSHLYATRSTFTTDDREEPAYYFEADNIKVIRDRILVGRPARLYFRNVPVFWLPFVAQDLTRGRRSGLLTPEFSINDIVRNRSVPAGATGTGRQISNLGVYWAINDYFDTQLSGAWRSGDYTGVRGALQYRWNSQFLQGNVSYSQFWRETGQRELQFFSNNSWRPDERTNMALNANFASTQFLREITTDYFQSTQNISSNLTLNRRFDWGSVDLGGSRQQSLANDQVTTEFPKLGVVLQPITLFRAPGLDQRWYNNATLTLSGSGALSSLVYGSDAPPQSRDEQRTNVRVTQGFSMGNIGLNSSFNLNRNLFPEVAPIDTFPGRPRVDRDQGQWQSNLSYRIALIGETSISPTLSVSQDLRRGTFGTAVSQIPFQPEPLVTEGYVASPLRTGFGASLNTALYGFLPGFGQFTAIRHKLTPGFSYTYVPEVALTQEQEQIFGRAGGRMQNNLTLLSLNQTFEAKIRPEADRPPADIEVREPGDTIAPADGASPTQAQAAPPEERKVTLLSINTTGFNYDFAPDTLGRRRGFTTRQVTNTVSSDYLRGLQITITHDLFDQTDLPFEERGTELGRFSPALTGVSTRFSLGQDSPFLRWLGLAGRVQEAPAQTDSIPAQPLPADPLNPMRTGSFTDRPQAAGRGPWRMDIGYTLNRPRDGGIAAHDLQIGTSFAPTANWAVNWYTNYSIEDGSFGGHRITLRRDLYRWEANFSFNRTPYGNTSFDVRILLKDLPDLKVDYREDNIGGVRR
jgi:lipopolysaccharide export system protein LptA